MPTHFKKPLKFPDPGRLYPNNRLRLLLNRIFDNDFLFFRAVLHKHPQFATNAMGKPIPFDSDCLSSNSSFFPDDE